MVLVAVSIGAPVSADWQDGVDAFGGGDYETARAEFSVVVREIPDYVGGYYMLGKCQMMLGEFDDGISNLGKAYELEPNNPMYLLDFARAQLVVEESQAVYSLLIGVDTASFNQDQIAIYRMIVAQAAIQTSQPEIAVEMMNAQLSEFGESGLVIRILGLALEKLHRSEEAVQAYMRAFELDPSDIKSAELALDLAGKIARGDGSDRQLREIAHLADRFAARYRGHRLFIFAGRVNLRLGEGQRASDWLELALAEQPFDPETLYLSALPLIRLGRSEEAYARLNLALGQQPSRLIGARISDEMTRIADPRVGSKLGAAARDHRTSTDETPMADIGALNKSFAEPLAQRESYIDQVLELREKAAGSGMGDDQQGAEEIGQTISGLEGNIALIDEEFEQVRTALEGTVEPAEAQRILQKMNQNLRQRLARPKPEDLGLTLLGIDELVVIIRPDQPSRTETPAGPPQLSAALSGAKEIPLPLRHTEVNASINAYIASVEVKQEYHNPYNEKIEVVYTFPLPHDASVNEFVMTIGKRKIRGIIRERHEAEEIYNEARKRGHVASLLTQERPNIFVQRIANIEPGKNIDVTVTYYNTLPYHDGGYEFRFPTVIGPRFNPPDSVDPVGAVARTQNQSSDTEVQYLKPTEISSHEISLSVDLEAGVVIESVHSATHEIVVEKVSASRRRITFANEGVLPNRDFILRWQVGGDLIKSAFLVHEDERGGFFTLVLTPPQDETTVSRSPVEHVFVIDCSGSMKGEPLRVAKRTAQRVLESLQPRDTFQIIQFSASASALGPRPIAATPAAIRSGIEYLASLKGNGGTMMIEGIKAALDFPHEPGRVRLVSLMTDGFIGNEAEILAAVHSRLGDSKVFSFGVGSAPNRFLLERMAKLGQGAAAYVTTDNDNSDQAIDDFIQRISQPVFSDITIDWGTTAVTEIYPPRIPDLHFSQPIVLVGRFSGKAGKRIIVNGYSAGKPARITRPLTQQDQRSRPELAQIWARMKIADIADQSYWAADKEPLISEIRDLALDFGLMSKYTAFLAVDSTSKTTGEQGVTVTQAVPVPADVKIDVTVAGGN